MIDGTYLKTGKCLLIAIDGDTSKVLAWQWANKETKTAYTTLLSRFVFPPEVLVCDGNRALENTYTRLWPHTNIQRCLVHVLRDCRRDLTSAPKSMAGRALWKLAKDLFEVQTYDDVADWVARLHAWYQYYKHLLNEKTFAKNCPTDPHAAKHTWWWTHPHLRRCYTRLETLYQEGKLFTYVDYAEIDTPIDRTTNRIEGGVNQQIKLLLTNHRGMPPEHQRRACDWLCYMKTPDPDPYHILNDSQKTPPHPTSERGEQNHGEQLGPGWGTGIQWNDFHTPTPYPNTTDN
ncbi:Transposase, Mutator family [Alloscardovia macacae]|uniref:Transposase, Mutator family n=1 Tax=Alloscardovia macacae TaxID=1160091 RepID=A0A261F633_9BIFI|nr:Transposase, Mutator family [Alloscardovia macacae]